MIGSPRDPTEFGAKLGRRHRQEMHHGRRNPLRGLRSRFLPVVALLGLAALATGCSSLAPRQFTGSGPAFDPIEFFTGRTRSWGVFENRAGEPSRRFSTVCAGYRKDGDVLLLDQLFTYEDGATQQRHWRIHRLDAHRYEATANDVVGQATGEAYGNAFHWEYTVALKPGNPLYNVRLRQWMYLQAGGQTMVNRASVNKLGLQVAQVTEFFWREAGSGTRNR